MPVVRACNGMFIIRQEQSMIKRLLVQILVSVMDTPPPNPCVRAMFRMSSSSGDMKI